MSSFEFSVTSAAQQVCVSGTDDRFEIKSVVNGEVVPFRVDGDPVFVGGDGGLCAVVDVPGEYVIEFTPDTCGVDPDPVFTVGAADPSDVCCASFVKDEEGNTIGVAIDGEEWVPEDKVVTYEYSDPDENGLITITGSDGSIQTIQLPPDSDAVTTDVVDDELVFYDADGNEIESLAQDLSSFISDPHPTISGTGDAEVTQDADGNWVIGFTDTDTDTTYTIQDGNLVGSDGSSIPVGGDTDVSAVKLDHTTNSLTVSVTENGNTVTDTMQIPNAPNRQCGDRALIRDSVTGDWVFKAIKPDARVKIDTVVVIHPEIEGPAVDALLGQTLVSISADSEPFEPQLACYSDLVTATIRPGNWSFIMGANGDTWRIVTTETSANPHMFRAPVISETSGDTTSNFDRDLTGATDFSIVGPAATYNIGWDFVFDPLVYTPHPANKLAGYAHVIKIKREQKTL